MKTAIITYSDAQNYGAQLQAYALQDTICSIGHECKVINYRNMDSRWFKPRKNIGDIIISLLLLQQGKERVRRFISFRKEYLQLTNKCVSEADLTQLNDSFDAFISGSDQVWSCSGRVNEDFFLRFVNANKIRAAYAPSFGKAEIPEKEVQRVSGYIKDFNFVSVREESGKKLINRITGLDVPVVIDPVFLKAREDWLKLINNNQDSNYIFVYTTQINKKLEESVRILKKKLKCKVISTQYIPGCNCLVRKNIGPIEFLEYIAGARYVLSTSFHATAFSVIFKKNFSVIPHNTTGARVVDLLESIALDVALVSDPKNYNFDCEYDWQTTEKLLDAKIASSKIYLNQIFEECR